MTKYTSKIRASAILVSSVILCAAGTTHATLIEGFESGFGPGELVAGDAGIQGSYFGIAAAQGNDQLLLTTINSTSGSADANGGYTNQSGNNSVLGSSLATFFGVSAGSIKDGSVTGKQGSGFTISLGALSAGQTISFNYDFLTQEANNGSTNKDFAFYTLTNQSGTTVITDVLSATSGTPGSTDPFGSQTQYHTLSINVTSPGTYTLGIGVVDAGSPSTDDAPSALLIDNIRLVPEPSTVALSVAGVVLLVALRSWMRKGRL